jgi:hypothetical protein
MVLLAALAVTSIAAACGGHGPESTSYLVVRKVRAEEIAATTPEVRAEAKDANRYISDVVKFCNSRINDRDDDANTSDALSIGGIVLGGLGAGASGVAAITSDEDVKTGIAISTAIVSAAAAVVASTQLIFTPAESGKVAKVISQQSAVENAADKTTAAALDVATATASVESQKRVVSARQTELDEARKKLLPAEQITVFQEIVDREKEALAALEKVEAAASSAYETALAELRTNTGALRTECVTFND